MGNVIILQQWGRGKAVDELLRARRARDMLDTRAQLAHSEHACRLFEVDYDPNERTIAGLLAATSLETDARIAVDDHSGALDRAERTKALIDGCGSPLLATEIGRRHVRRCHEVADGADRAMRETLAAYIRLDRQPQMVPGVCQRAVEQLSALTMVLSSAHRLGKPDAISFGHRALDMAQRSVELGPSLLSSVRVHDARTAARFAMWAGIFLSGSANSPNEARPLLSSYLEWSHLNPTRRNQLLEQFVVGELLVNSSDATAARGVFIGALERTALVLPRKHRVASQVLARREVI